jgi:hypothetical protein
VTERVVDVLEPIDVEEQERRAFVRSVTPFDRRRERPVHVPPLNALVSGRRGNNDTRGTHYGRVTSNA